nr:hypothetical protein [Tanacetum cinerariifolium]
MTTLAEFMIVAGVENRPPMLDKAMYNLWEIRMLFYIKGKKNGRVMLKSIENGPLVYPTVEEDGKIRKKKYAELTEQEQLQDDCDVQATNIVLQGLPPDVYSLLNHFQSAKDIWERVKLLVKGAKLSYQELPNNAYLTPTISPQPQAEFPQLDSALAVLLHHVFLQPTTNSDHPPTQEIKMGELPFNKFKEHRVKVILEQESGQVLDEEQLAFLADPRITDCYDIQPTIIHNAAFQTDDLDACDPDCDDISYTKAVLMANLSSYDSDVLSEETKTVNESLTAELERYKECVKVFEQRQNIDLNSREKLIDSQMDDMIRNSENLVLRAKLAKKEHMIEKKFFDEVVLRCSWLENHCVNLELKLQHQKESFLNNKSLNNQDAPEIQEFFNINEWKAKLNAIDVSIANLRKHIKSLKGKNVIEKDATPHKANIIALGMIKLDLDLLSPKALKNKDAHIDYIRPFDSGKCTLRKMQIFFRN